MKKICITILVIGILATTPKAFALSLRSYGLDFSNITTTSAVVQLNPNADYLKRIKENTQIKIQYRPWMCGDDPTTAPYTACPMIYIEPSTEVFTSVKTSDAQPVMNPITLEKLQPNTKYRVWLGYDNGMRCIQTPCRSDTWDETLYSFTTLPLEPTEENPFPNVQLLTQKLSLGVRSPQVNILENFLLTQNYMNNHIDSYYGTTTRAAIKKFQRDHQLTADGIVGTKTRALINQLLNSSEKSQ